MSRVRGMWARGLPALLLVAAVLSMHGLPSMGAAHAGEESAVATSHSVMSMPPGAPLDVSAALAGVSAMTLDRLVGTSSSDLPHEVTVHLWGACLAVLLAGMMLVGAVILSRRGGSGLDVQAWRRLWACARTWCRPPRPPDLFALCVMRT